jgi:hypothetical protein
MATLLPIFEMLRIRGIKVTVDTRQPEEHSYEYCLQSIDTIARLQNIGVSVLYTGRLHRKIAIIDNVLWDGSLNILSYNDSSEIMRRIESAYLSAEMIRFVKVRSRLD